MHFALDIVHKIPVIFRVIGARPVTGSVQFQNRDSRAPVLFEAPCRIGCSAVIDTSFPRWLVPESTG